MKFADNFLEKLESKIDRKERISEDETLRLFESKDILGLGYIADKLRRQKVGEVVTFVGNYHICYSNICLYNCKYCTFRRKAGDSDAFTLNLEEIENLAEESKKNDVPEILMLGGIHPELNLEFFIEALTRIKRRVPEVKILAFSPIEIDHLARQENKSIDEIFDILKQVGLSAITGGGAEIFSPRVRELLGCAEKISGKRWLEIMEKAHNHDVYSNASMLYGAGETYEERIEHMLAIREVQDRTGKFTHFLPFTFSNDYFPLTTGYEDIKMLAISRIFLDNFTHIRAYWSHLGLQGAQISLSFGADDLNGLKQKGRIIHSSGGESPKLTKKEIMIDTIRDAGRIPAERDILFNIIKVYD